MFDVCDCDWLPVIELLKAEWLSGLWNYTYVFNVFFQNPKNMTFTFFELLHTFFRTRPKAIKTRGSAVAERERERERESRSYLFTYFSTNCRRNRRQCGQAITYSFQRCEGVRTFLHPWRTPSPCRDLNYPATSHSRRSTLCLYYNPNHGRNYCRNWPAVYSHEIKPS